jgi:hypothetical protein
MGAKEAEGVIKTRGKALTAWRESEEIGAEAWAAPIR